jgi:hypothetical protein
MGRKALLVAAKPNVKTDPITLPQYPNLNTESSTEEVVQKTSAEQYASQVKANNQALQREIKMDPNNMYWPEYGLSKDVKVIYKQSTTKFAVLTPDEWNVFFTSLDSTLTVKDAVTGLYNARETAKALGGLGTVVFVKEIDGIEYLILKNYDKWSQTLLHGGVFKANNERIVKLGLGALGSTKGMVRYVRVTAPMEILIGSAINILQFILNDEYSLKRLGIDEAKLFVNAFATAFTAIGIGLFLPEFVATAVGALTILAVSNLIVWGVDKATDFESKLVSKTVEMFE